MKAGDILALLRDLAGLTREALKAGQERLRKQLAAERAARIAAERRAHDAERARQIMTHIADIDRRKS